MTKLRRIRQNIEVQPFRDEVAAASGLWTAGQADRRDLRPAIQSIPLRSPVKSMIGPRRRRDLQDSSYTAAAQGFPAARAFLESFAAARGAELGRARILRLRPGRGTRLHFGQGEYHRFRDRYHLVLQSAADSGFICGGVAAGMEDGELWRLDIKALQEAYNRGPAERVHMVFDLLPRARFAQVYGRARAA
ncbi:MAG: aspartyl/asparaginyl beta-hydroxylase domain-containing protein [Kiloniellales bacterium]|nr:aspartyl/asparaginyl beta-hydroxylase domain-containing protein [Kiloniellales bacterium]